MPASHMALPARGNPCAAQNAQRLGAGQNAGLVFICIVAQCGTIANKNQRLFALFYKSFQRSDRFGGVRGQPGVGGKVKPGPVHLAAAGVLCANHSAFPAHAVSQGSHGGNPGAGGVGRKSQPLDGGKTDAQPGKAARDRWSRRTNPAGRGSGRRLSGRYPPWAAGSRCGSARCWKPSHIIKYRRASQRRRQFCPPYQWQECSFGVSSSFPKGRGVKPQAG